MGGGVFGGCGFPGDSLTFRRVFVSSGGGVLETSPEGWVCVGGGSSSERQAVPVDHAQVLLPGETASLSSRRR